MPEIKSSYSRIRRISIKLGDKRETNDNIKGRQMDERKVPIQLFLWYFRNLSLCPE